MKRGILFGLCLALLLGMGGCAAPDGGTGGFRVLCTNFPLYDWVRELTDGIPEVEAALLVGNGADLHSYQPTVADVASIQECDLLVYIGGESDAWVAEALAAAEGSPQAAAMLPLLDGHLMEEHEDHDHGGETEYDEHVWLSLRNAQLCVRAVAQTLAQALPEAEARLTANADRYCGALAALDARTAAAAEDAPVRSVLFADRFPFLYWMEDYGLHYDAAFPGCSAETEAGFDTVVRLADTLRGQRLPAILVLEGNDGRLAATLQETAGVQVPVLELHSMQSVTREQAEKGASYLAYMERNCQTLLQALGAEEGRDLYGSDQVQ